jgi:hypothetical protein
MTSQVLPALDDAPAFIFWNLSLDVEVPTALDHTLYAVHSIQYITCLYGSMTQINNRFIVWGTDQNSFICHHEKSFPIRSCLTADINSSYELNFVTCSFPSESYQITLFKMISFLSFFLEKALNKRRTYFHLAMGDMSN